eukprot:8897181-Pyramimonas_sp.AAC.1
MAVEPHANAAIGAFGGAPNGATIRHANAAIGAFGGAPYGATNRVKGVPKWVWNSTRMQPLGPSVELPMGPRNL